jgi:DNA repair exonuclease SbcCD ATPase subunit
MYLSTNSLDESDTSTQTPPASPAAPSFTYTDASVGDITGPVVAISDMVAMTVSAPSYSEPVSSLTTFPTITWSFPNVPVAPRLSSSSISFSQTAPSFTPPIMSSPDFSDANTWINTEEDSEMLSSRVQTIQSQIGEYSARLQESQAAFNKENAEYQAQLQISLQNAQLDSQDDGQIIQKHGSDINAYQAEVNKIIQGNQQEIAEWQAENSVKLQKYGSDIQNELNIFNKENIEYQQDIQRKAQNLQKDIQEKVQEVQNSIGVKKHNLDKSVQIALQNAIQNFQKEVQEYTAKLEKYNAELNQYQGDVAKEVQDYTNTLQKEVQEYQSKLALYTADLQKYQNLIADETQKAAVKTQNAGYYMQESDKYYKWYQSEVMAYIQNNSRMISQTIAAQAAKQQ